MATTYPLGTTSYPAAHPAGLFPVSQRSSLGIFLAGPSAQPFPNLVETGAVAISPGAVDAPQVGDGWGEGSLSDLRPWRRSRGHVF
ncbi:MAG: hypothetical protein ACM36C_00110, partial [Acidobacteriota bacterium]